MPAFQKDVSLIRSIPAVRSILEVVCRVTGMRFAAVARVTENRWVACEVLDEIEFGLKPGGELVVDTTICHEIRQTQEAVVIDHVAESACYRDHHTPRMYGFQSYISMPIVLSDGRFFGTLCAIDPKPANLETPEVIGMFRLFAELIGRHIEEAEKLAESESKLAAEQETSALREQFIAVLGHDLRNPLSAIGVGASLLSEMPLEPRTLKIVAMMKEGAAKMTSLIEDVMDFARGRLGGGIQIERMVEAELDPVLHQVVTETGSVWHGRVIETEFDLAVPVRCDPRRIAQLFTNLLGNAMHHGCPATPVRVRAVSREAMFELSVANAAEEIPPDTLERMFQPFVRGESKDYKEGLGLGLYIASEIARAHGGSLEVSSGGGEVRFFFRMDGRADA